MDDKLLKKLILEQVKEIMNEEVYDSPKTAYGHYDKMIVRDPKVKQAVNILVTSPAIIEAMQSGYLDGAEVSNVLKDLLYREITMRVPGKPARSATAPQAKQPAPLPSPNKN